MRQVRRLKRQSRIPGPGPGDENAGRRDSRYADEDREIGFAGGRTTLTTTAGKRRKGSRSEHCTVPLVPVPDDLFSVPGTELFHPSPSSQCSSRLSPPSANPSAHMDALKTSTNLTNLCDEILPSIVHHQDFNSHSKDVEGCLASENNIALISPTLASGCSKYSNPSKLPAKDQVSSGSVTRLPNALTGQSSIDQSLKSKISKLPRLTKNIDLVDDKSNLIGSRLASKVSENKMDHQRVSNTPFITLDEMRISSNQNQINQTHIASSSSSMDYTLTSRMAMTSSSAPPSSFKPSAVPKRLKRQSSVEALREDLQIACKKLNLPPPRVSSITASQDASNLISPKRFTFQANVPKPPASSPVKSSTSTSTSLPQICTEFGSLSLTSSLRSPSGTHPTSSPISMKGRYSSSQLSIPELDAGSADDSFNPLPLRYPRMSKRLSRASKRTSTSSDKLAVPPSPFTPKSPKSPKSFSSVSSATSTRIRTTSRTSLSTTDSAKDLRDVLQKASKALANSPNKAMAVNDGGTIKTGVYRRSSKRDSFASIASTLYSTEDTASLTHSSSNGTLSSKSLASLASFSHNTNLEAEDDSHLEKILEISSALLDEAHYHLGKSQASAKMVELNEFSVSPPRSHQRCASRLSFVNDFPIPPSRPTLQVVVEDEDKIPQAQHALSNAGERKENGAESEIHVDLNDEESDMDLYSPLVDVALRNRIISPNSRLTRFASNSSASSSSSDKLSTPTGTPRSSSPHKHLHRNVYTPESMRSKRSSNATLRPLSLASRHTGEGWSGSESEEEEYIQAIKRISMKRLSTSRLRRIPSLLVRPNARRSVTYSTYSEKASSTTLSQCHNDQFKSPLSVNISKTEREMSINRLSNISGISGASGSTLSDIPITPCASTDGGYPLPSPGLPDTINESDEIQVMDRTRSLPRPKKKIKGWGMPEILIDEEWSSSGPEDEQDREQHPWSSDDDNEIWTRKGGSEITVRV